MSDSDDELATGDLVYFWKPRGDERVFELREWPEAAVTMVASLLEAGDVAHRWEDRDLVVDAGVRNEAQDVLDEVVESFAPRLAESLDRVAYDLAGWPDFEVDRLVEALQQAQVVHEWTEEGELLVAEADEELVDALFEALDLRGPEDGKAELDGEELSALLTALFVSADRMARNAQDGDAVIGFATAAVQLGGVALPVGFDAAAWDVVGNRCAELRRILAEDDSESSDEDIAVRAGEIRDRLQVWL
ncbi:MAG: hypothetical protein OEY23_14730 [Acidimicrobiia bacterium]|nr:hypothetical protein [Acidimicrobiia bacterium]